MDDGYRTKDDGQTKTMKTTMKNSMTPEDKMRATGKNDHFIKVRSIDNDLNEEDALSQVLPPRPPTPPKKILVRTGPVETMKTASFASIPSLPPKKHYSSAARLPPHASVATPTRLSTNKGNASTDANVVASPFPSASTILPHLRFCIRLIHALQKERGASCAIAAAGSHNVGSFNKDHHASLSLDTNNPPSVTEIPLDGRPRRRSTKVLSGLSMGLSFAERAATVSRRETDAAFFSFLSSAGSVFRIFGNNNECIDKNKNRIVMTATNNKNGKNDSDNNKETINTNGIPNGRGPRTSRRAMTAEAAETIVAESYSKGPTMKNSVSSSPLSSVGDAASVPASSQPPDMPALNFPQFHGHYPLPKIASTQILQRTRSLPLADPSNQAGIVHGFHRTITAYTSLIVDLVDYVTKVFQPKLRVRPEEWEEGGVGCSRDGNVVQTSDCNEGGITNPCFPSTSSLGPDANETIPCPLLSLLLAFIRLKECITFQRGLLGGILGLPSDDCLPYLPGGMLFNDLVLCIEMQETAMRDLRRTARDMVGQGADIAGNMAHCRHGSLLALVEDGTAPSKALEDLQDMMRYNYDLRGIRRTVTFKHFWSLMSAYIDRLYSLELLIIEEIETWFCGANSMANTGALPKSDNNFGRAATMTTTTTIPKENVDMIRSRPPKIAMTEQGISPAQQVEQYRDEKTVVAARRVAHTIACSSVSAHQESKIDDPRCCMSIPWSSTPDLSKRTQSFSTLDTFSRELIGRMPPEQVKAALLALLKDNSEEKLEERNVNNAPVANQDAAYTTEELPLPQPTESDAIVSTTADLAPSSMPLPHKTNSSLPSQHATSLQEPASMPHTLSTPNSSSFNTDLNNNKNSNNEEWEIDLYEVLFTRRIGKGAAGTTYLARWSGQNVAVKVASLNEIGMDGWSAEVQSLQRLHHPNVIRLLGCIQHQSPMTKCLVLEYCDSGDLKNVLSKPTPPGFFVSCANSIASGMAYLHRRNFMHRDLKPANVLLHGNVNSGDFVVKVTDFGVAKKMLPTFKDKTMQNTNDMTAETGTYRWMAPEVIRHEPYSFEADVYSFALIMWQLITHEDPFEPLSQLLAAGRVAIEEARPPFPKGAPSSLVELIVKCWSEKPQDRPTMADILQFYECWGSTHHENRIDWDTWLDTPTGHPVYKTSENNNVEDGMNVRLSSSRKMEVEKKKKIDSTSFRRALRRMLGKGKTSRRPYIQ